MKGFIKELKELQQAGKKLVDERKAIKAKELAEKKAIEAKELAEKKAIEAKELAEWTKQLKEREEKEKELKTKIANVPTFSSSNVEINQNFGMVFCAKDDISRPPFERLGKEVLTELKRQTLKRGGDAIINLRFDFTMLREYQSDALSMEVLLIGYGDAVKLRK